MKEGISTVIEYGMPDGVRRYGEPRPTDHAGMGAVDPNWYVWHADANNPSSGEYEWLHYMTLDGSLWSVKLHCRIPTIISPQASIVFYFEHKPYLGGPDHDDTIMNFLDWDGNPWQAKALPIPSPLPAKPRFGLRKLFGKSFKSELFSLKSDR